MHTGPPGEFVEASSIYIVSIVYTTLLSEWLLYVIMPLFDLSFMEKKAAFPA
jgi:hypothetical protein